MSNKSRQKKSARSITNKYEQNKIIENYMNKITYNQQLIHFEQLLINKLNNIELKYDKKISIIIITTTITLISWILSLSSDSIVIKILTYLLDKQEIKISLFRMIYILPYILLIFVQIFLLFRLVRLKRGIKVKLLKEPYTQSQIFWEFIYIECQKYLPCNPEELDFHEYYLKGNKTEIIFSDIELMNFISKKYNKVIDNDIEIERYLLEVIILRQLLSKNIIECCLNRQYKLKIYANNYIHLTLIVK